MHFTDSLFSVLKQDTGPGGSKFKLRLNAGHPVYRGHFPDNPITPGVCSLEIITQLTASNYTGFERPSLIESIKYLGFVNPLLTPEVEVELKIGRIEKGVWRVRGMLSAGGKKAVKTVASYKIDV